MRSGRKLFAALVVAVGLGAPATAQAAVTATLTGDDGQPALLNAAAPPSLRNMTVDAGVQVGATDAESWKSVVTGPGEIPATTETCWSSLTSETNRVKFQGNGLYKLTISLYSADSCVTPKGAPIVYTWNIEASVAVGQPAGPLLTRPANSFTTNAQLLDFSGNPGAQSYEIRYAKGGVLGPDGGISGVSQTAYVDSATGKIKISPDSPGSYLVVARAQSGDYFTAWSAPVTLTMIAPFDISTWSFPDSRGPSYQVRATLRESTAGGRVTVAIAKGKNGKRFRTLGKAKVNSKGVFKLRFRVTKRGTYRLRYSFRGSSTVQRGTVYESIKIRRILL
jgi:hypothetical protein